MKNLETIIKNQLTQTEKIEVSYICKTTRTNSEYIIVKIGTEEYNKYDSSEPKGFATELETAVNALKQEHPNLHVISRSKELHFHYPGFNNVSHCNLPVEISNTDPAKEIKKTGKITAKFNMAGRAKALELVAQHPDYEIYLRHGFGFRGAQECILDKAKTYPIWYREGFYSKKKLVTWEEYLKHELSGMACCDITVQDNEIHINTFSYNDME